MSIYIHIPFCNNICSYCDFCKFFYNESLVDKYLESLEKEIKKNYQNEEVKTIYIGGGTPSCLTKSQLNKLLNLTNYFNKSTDLEFTIEINPEMELDKIELFKQYKINRVSIGMQTINSNHLKLLNRNHTENQIKQLVLALKQNNITNINIDLMYALPNETIDDLNNDLKFLLSLDVPHISTYSLMIEPHTKLYIDSFENIDEDIDALMYRTIIKTLKQNKYIHYETSNFALKEYESKHNLVYWNNLEYYGFGVGASGYINSVRYDNTKSLKDYNIGKYRSEEVVLSKKEKIENEFILGFRKINGISIKDFKTKYDIDLLSIPIVNKLLIENRLIIKDDNIMIHPNYQYLANQILINFINIEEEI